MHDFGRLVYLDLQKTGSTFVSRFLNDACKLTVIRDWKHGRISSRRRDKKAFYFITVRHPMAQYSSLFRYGLDGKGALYERLLKLGKADLYDRDADAFCRWLRFVLDYKNAGYLGEGFEKVPENYNLGFLSFRYLMLSLARPEKTLLKKPETMDLIDYARKETIVDHTIRTEELNDGLIELATVIKPEYFDQEKALEFIRQNARANIASIRAEEIREVDRETRALMLQKERLLMSFYS